jgi:flagellar assembly protein FliH
MKKRSRILRNTDSGKLTPVTFRSFDRRPINYFRDVIVDEEREAARQVSEQEIRDHVESLLAAEKSRLQDKHERALQERFKAGLAKGREEAASEYKRAAELLNEYARILQAERKEQAERCERSAVDLAFTLAEKIIGRELETKPETVADIARNALQQVMDAQQVCLRVNPQDADYLRGLQVDLQSMLSTNAQLEVRGDTGIERGSCLIETEHGALDARVGSQLNTMRAATQSQAGNGAQAQG